MAGSSSRRFSLSQEDDDMSDGDGLASSSLSASSASSSRSSSAQSTKRHSHSATPQLASSLSSARPDVPFTPISIDELLSAPSLQSGSDLKAIFVTFTPELLEQLFQAKQLIQPSSRSNTFAAKAASGSEAGSEKKAAAMSHSGSASSNSKDAKDESKEPVRPKPGFTLHNYCQTHMRYRNILSGKSKIENSKLKKRMLGKFKTVEEIDCEIAACFKNIDLKEISATYLDGEQSYLAYLPWNADHVIFEKVFLAGLSSVKGEVAREGILSAKKLSYSFKRLCHYQGGDLRRNLIFAIRALDIRTLKNGKYYKLSQQLSMIKSTHDIMKNIKNILGEGEEYDEAERILRVSVESIIKKYPHLSNENDESQKSDDVEMEAEAASSSSPSHQLAGESYNEDDDEPDEDADSEMEEAADSKDSKTSSNSFSSSSGSTRSNAAAASLLKLSFLSPRDYRKRQRDATKEKLQEPANKKSKLESGKPQSVTSSSKSGMFSSTARKEPLRDNSASASASMQKAPDR